MELLAHETRWRHGGVPHELGGIVLTAGQRLVADGRYLLRCESGYGYLYEPGQGITIERPEGADPQEESLWLNGSVYAAVASLNGFLPFHASAVAHAGRVFAFTGPAGAGKSTLVAGLGRHGLPMFCDDTLLLDLADPEAAICMPGHKRLKLLPDAVEMTGARIIEPVGAETGKLYSAPPGGEHGEPLPLDTLVFLEDGPELAWLPISGAERLLRLDDDHHTRDVFLEASRPTREAIFTQRARLARRLDMVRLVRPRSRERFAAMLDFVAQCIRGKGMTDSHR